MEQNKFKDFIADNKLADKSLIEFLEDTDITEKTLESYQQYLIQSGKSTAIFTSFTKKASSALKSLGAEMASMAVNWLIGKVIDLVAIGIDKLGNASKHAAESAKALASEMKNSISSFSSNTSTLSDLNDEYRKLSKGVNKLGENVGLSTEDYSRYKDIISQVSTIMPNMTTYFNNQGEKIAFAKGKLEDLNKEYEDYYKKQAQDYIANGNGNKIQDILNSYNSNKEFTGFEKFWSEFKNALGDINANNFTTKDIIDELEKFKDRDHIQNSIEKLNSYLPNFFTPWRIVFNAPKHYDQDAALKRTIINELGLNRKTQDDIVNMTEEEYNALMQKINAHIQKYKTKIASDMNQINPALIKVAHNSESYWEKDPNIKNNIITFLSSINSDVWDELKINTDDEIIVFVNNIIESMSNNTNGFADAWNGLFSPDLKDLPINEYLQQIDGFLKTTCKVLGLDEKDGVPLLKFSLGFGGYDDMPRKFQNAVGALIDDSEILNSKEYAELVEIINKLTIDEAELCLKAITDAESVTEAIIGIKETLKSIRDDDPASSDIFSLKDADNNLTTLGKISESIDTIQNAYKTLHNAIDEYNGEGAFSIDTLQSVIALGDDWLDYLVDAEGNLKLDKEALEDLTQARLNDMRVQAINNVIDNVSKIHTDEKANEYLASTNYSLAESYEALAKAKLDDAEASMTEAVKAGTLSQENMDNAIKKAAADIAKIKNLFENTSINADSIFGGSGESGSNSSKSDFSETINFFEQRVKNLDNAISHLKSTMDNISGSFAKNNLVDAELGITGEKFQNYTNALAMYTQKANEALSKLPSDIAAKVKDGAVALTDFIGDGNKDVVEAIKDYESWADKVADCKQELAELKKEISQLELEKFNNIMNDFKSQFSLRSDSKNLISKQVDLLKEAGELIGKSFFTAQIDQSKKQLELLEAEKAQLVNQMSSAIGSGRIQKGTDEWLEMVNALSDVDGSILDCKKSIEEFDNSILDLHTEIFTRIQDQFSNLNSEISNIIDLFDEFDVSDDKGIWSKKGIAQLGLLTQQYELAQYQIQQYNNEIDELNAQYLAGKYSATEYADRLAELSSAQWDAVKASESAKDAIMELNETRVENEIKGIEKEIDAYKELIDAQIDALKASKDLHDYEKSIADKTKSITDLERQIAAMQNDNSAATIAKRKKLEEQLAEAKKDLEEAEYDHSITTQEDALNKQYEQYEKFRNDEIDALRDSLNDKEAIISASFETVKDNASTVGQEIATIATQHGITVSKSLISSWQSGEKAIASYGAVLSQNTSAFIGNIMGVENEVWNLQTQANTTADSLAWMFSTKADNLVDELITSYFAEANLANMTNALQQSLVNTLERGYDVSSIVNSLNSVASAANSAKAAIDRLNNSNIISNDTPDAGENVNAQKQKKQKPNQQYQLIDKTTGKIWKDNLSYAEALKYKKDHVTDINTTLLEKYASGARNITKDRLAVTNEDGQELIYHAADGSILTPLRQGDKVFSNEAIERLWEIGQGLMPPDMIRNLSMPTVLPNNVNNNSVNVHYDSMITVQGSLNSTDVKQMEAIANKAVDKMIDKIHDGITYGI